MADISTLRLLLRPLALEDAEAYGRLLRDPAVHPFVVENGPVPQSQILDRIAHKQREWLLGTGATWAVLRGLELIGYVTLHGLGRPRVAISYALMPSAHGAGLGREAVTAVLTGARSLGFTEVEARTHHTNDASVRLLRAVGFVELEPIDSPPRRVFVWSTAS